MIPSTRRLITITPVSEDPSPSSGLCGHCTYAAQTHIQAKHPLKTVENRAGPECDLLGQKLRWKKTLGNVFTSSQQHKQRCNQVHSQFQQGQSSIAQASSRAADCQSALTMELFTWLLWAGSSLWIKRTPRKKQGVKKQASYGK